MGFFSKPKKVVASTADADKEKNDAAKIKARLLETEGGALGSELAQNQGRNLRKIF